MVLSAQSKCGGAGMGGSSMGLKGGSVGNGGHKMAPAGAIYSGGGTGG
jgi:hypothetical protein